MHRVKKILRRVQSLSLGEVIWVTRQGNKVILYKLNQPRVAFLVHASSCDVHVYVEGKALVYDRLGDEVTAQLVAATIRRLPALSTKENPVLRGRDKLLLIREFIHETVS